MPDSGDVFVRIRSAKYVISSAFTSAHDLIKLFKCRFTPQKPLTPLLLMEMNGTYNEAPQCLKPMHKTVHLFKEVKLDTLTQSANAAGLSRCTIQLKDEWLLCHMIWQM